MESSWKGRVKRIHAEDVFAEVERAAQSLSNAVGFWKHTSSWNLNHYFMFPYIFDNIQSKVLFKHHAHTITLWRNSHYFGYRFILVVSLISNFKWKLGSHNWLIAYVWHFRLLMVLPVFLVVHYTKSLVSFALFCSFSLALNVTIDYMVSYWKPFQVGHGHGSTY